jgi:hypothetical protein
MAFKISWVGVKGLKRPQLLARLGMDETSALDRAHEASFALSETSKGWLILYANDFDYASEPTLAALSAGASVIGCRVLESIGFSGAEQHQRGRKLWSVSHTAQRGPLNLEESGRTPLQLTGIKQRLLAKQAAAGDARPIRDYVFDIPIELAASITGYRHDQGEHDFKVLKPASNTHRDQLGALFAPGGHPRPSV